MASLPSGRVAITIPGGTPFPGCDPAETLAVPPSGSSRPPGRRSLAEMTRAAVARSAPSLVPWRTHSGGTDRRLERGLPVWGAEAGPGAPLVKGWFLPGSPAGPPAYSCPEAVSHPGRSPGQKIRVERVQTRVRIEKRMLKVLKALAEYLDLSLGDLLEGIVLHAFDGNPSPLGEEILTRVEMLKRVYDMDYDSSTAHNFEEIDR